MPGEFGAGKFRHGEQFGFAGSIACLHGEALQAATQGPGWGFGYGWAVLVDPKAAGTPQSAGTLQWGGAYGHNWFVDPEQKLTVVALTNTAFEGMSGPFTIEVRDAIYGVAQPK